MANSGERRSREGFAALPIALGLTWPDRVPDTAPPVDWTRSETWEFFPLDDEAFPSVSLARAAGAASLMGASYDVPLAHENPLVRIPVRMPLLPGPGGAHHLVEVRPRRAPAEDVGDARRAGHQHRRVAFAA